MPPHSDQPLLTVGPEPRDAAATIILLHGRGSPASNMLRLGAALGLENLAQIIPQAADYTWYPMSFLAPLQSNQPHLDSALARIEAIVTDLAAQGVGPEKLILMGFSQGACLACEFTARHARRYGGIIALSGGLIGPPGTPRDYPGDLAGTPVLLGSDERDPIVPFDRVKETQTILTAIGASVELRAFPGLAHSMNEEEIAAARALITKQFPTAAAREPLAIPGLHHVTAITADPQKNLNFYRDLLGLHLVKLTVNFDDPSSYHLYYGDAIGRPGTVLTFFAWPGAPRGVIGPPQVTATSFAVPAGSMEYWSRRLAEHSIPTQPSERFGQPVLTFSDPDGMAIELIGVAGLPGHEITGFHSVTLSEEGHERTSHLLTETFGFSAAGEEQNRFRYCTPGKDGSAKIVDLLCLPAARRGDLGAGIVHHVAFRAPTEFDQLAWHRRLPHAGLNVSPIMDRTYFQSIYFREPGGVLFEIATDAPGFTVDEKAEDLGRRLMLPRWLEIHRAQIERSLPKLELGGQSA